MHAYSDACVDRFDDLRGYQPGHESKPASGLLWQVENPFRFFKDHKPFALHEAAFASLRNYDSAIALPDLVRRTERVLNDPDCRDASTPDRCAATAGRHYQQSRLGWAAQTLGHTCYDRDGRPARYRVTCDMRKI